MRGWLWNGHVFAPADSVPLSDRGFRYGMSLFESLAVEQGNVEFWEGHRRRLEAACVERDFLVDSAALEQAKEALAGAGMDGFARIYVTAGDGGPSAPAQPRVFVMLEARSRPEEDCWEIGFCDEPWTPIFAGLKTGNYWRNCDALATARARGFDEGILFNDHAEVVSACCGNVFVVHGEEILTPSRASGCRLGVVREWVTTRRKVHERRLRREDVVNAEEIFLTNSWIGVMPIATLEGRPLGPRRISAKLAAEWQQGRRG